ncbi:hypothetical protein FNV43_RR02681 [Rhamnella rubrinervis]|uniref:Uncharacterized protein n=1 Tax=Rhamnella rubrinervis TaxID=2594499 RepID=A0A8K0MTX7_9ROSA|nr:hypothetical protein FNV43_RR02681 [Rhamnella rubrinervis]
MVNDVMVERREELVNAADEKRKLAIKVLVKVDHLTDLTPLAQRFSSPSLETKQDDLSWLTKGAPIRGGQIIYFDFEVEGEEVGVVASGSTPTGVKEAKEERRTLKGERGGDRSALNLSEGRPVFPYACHYSGFSNKWLFVTGDWEGVPASCSISKTVEPTTELAKKIRLVNVGLSRLEQVSTGDLPIAAGSSSDPAVDPSMVEAIKNIFAGKRSAFGPTSRGSTPKMQRMASSGSMSVTPSKSTSSTRVRVGQTPISRVTKSQANHKLAERYQAKNVQAPPSRQAPKGLSALISTVNSAISPQFRSKEMFQGIFVELEVLKKETNDNVLLGYSIIRRVVAQKFSGYNMIELDHLATKEAQKGEQPILAEFDEPIRVEPGVQEAGEDTEKVVEVVEIETTTEEENKN